MIDIRNFKEQLKMKAYPQAVDPSAKNTGHHLEKRLSQEKVAKRGVKSRLRKKRLTFQASDSSKTREIRSMPKSTLKQRRGI
jgi:hypothetical protein